MDDARMYWPIHRWLDKHIGKDRWAWHSGPHGGPPVPSAADWRPGIGNWQSSFIYFYSASEAAIFIATFGLTEYTVGVRDHVPSRG